MPPIQVLSGVRGVRMADLPREVIAGVTLAALAIPLNIGYAQVAGLPAIPACTRRSCRWLVFAAAVVVAPARREPRRADRRADRLAPARHWRRRRSALGPAGVRPGAGVRADLLRLWALRLGFLANFLSRAVLIGFISGLGIEVFTSQIPKMMGISVEGEEWLDKVVGIITGIPRHQPLCPGRGRRHVRPHPRAASAVAPQLPGALIALIVMTVVGRASSGWTERGVSVLGDGAGGSAERSACRRSGSPTTCAAARRDRRSAGSRWPTGCWSRATTPRSAASRIDADQELFAFGAANVAAGLTGAMIVGSSGSRTAAMDGQGSRSQIPSLVGAGVVVAVVLLFFASLLALLPNAALGGIVANAVLSPDRDQRAARAVPRASLRVRGRRRVPAERAAARHVAGGGDRIPAVGRSTWSAARRRRRPSAHHGAGPHRVPLRRRAVLRQRPHLQRRREAVVATAPDPPRWFVLDAEAISDIDTTAADALRDIEHWLAERKISFGVARMTPEVRALLAHYEVDVPDAMVFPTNRAAEEAFARQAPSDVSRQ